MTAYKSFVKRVKPCNAGGNWVFGLQQRQRKTFVRSGVRTHARIRGPEYSSATGGKGNLESGALDHSAILTGLTS